jgi:predicted transcriptional regulator
MYKLIYCTQEVEKLFTKRHEFWDSELEQELSPVLETLKQFGEVAGADCGVKPGISSVVYGLKGRNFHISYAVDTANKKVIFYDFKMVSHNIDWKTALEEKIDSDQAICIPQIGDPQKLIRTIELIHSGINTSKELGIAFDSNTKVSRYLERRGQYLAQPIIEIGLAKRVKSNGKSVYVLTEKGLKIANSSDKETRERLLVESLLSFPPIQMIIEETTHGNKELTLELIQKIISTVTLDDCAGTTSPRRASSLRALVNWITRWAGIPIRREGNFQLYIPYIYSTPESGNTNK